MGKTGVIHEKNKIRRSNCISGIAFVSYLRYLTAHRRGAPLALHTDRAVSSVGRASRLHREGRQFETVTAHHSPNRCEWFPLLGACKIRLEWTNTPHRTRLQLVQQCFLDSPDSKTTLFDVSICHESRKESGSAFKLKALALQFFNE
mgnify:FL=1